MNRTTETGKGRLRCGKGTKELLQLSRSEVSLHVPSSLGDTWQGEGRKMMKMTSMNQLCVSHDWKLALRLF